MKLIILILLLSLGLGYYITYHIIIDNDLQWYAYFVTNDLKAFLISLALMAVTYKTKNFPFAVCAGSVSAYDLAIQVFDVNTKGNWAEAMYIVLLSLALVYFFVSLYNDARTNH